MRLTTGAWVRRVDVEGVWVSDAIDVAQAGWRLLPHAALAVEPGSTLAQLLQAWPEAMWRSPDPALAAALLALPEPIADGVALARPLPRLDQDAGRAALRDALRHPDLAGMLRFEDHDGGWRVTGIESDGRVALLADGPDRPGRALPGPAGPPSPLGGGVRRRAMGATQLGWVAPGVAKALALAQEQGGAVLPDGTARPRGARVDVLLRAARDRASRALDRAREHLALSRRLREDPRRSRAWQAQVDRLQAAVSDVDAGRAARVLLGADAVSTFGIGLATGGTTGAHLHAGEDRLRVADTLRARYLGDLRLMMVAGGDPASGDATGPALSRVLDTIEPHIARAVHGAVDLDDALRGARDAILATALNGQAGPGGSLLVVLQCPRTGELGALWLGTAALWRFRNGILDRLTWGHTHEGLVGLGIAAGLRPADAVALLLCASHRRADPADLDVAGPEVLATLGERVAAAGRRDAVRAGLGVSRDLLVDEHQRLVQLFARYRGVYDRHLDDRALRDGAAMLLVQTFRIHPGDRLVLASDGFEALHRSRPDLVNAALRLRDPQQAAAWLCDAVHAGEHDDLALVIHDAPPTQRVEATHRRRLGLVYERTADPAAPLDEAVFPGLPDGTLPALRVRLRGLARYLGEVEDLLRARRLPDPTRDPGAFAEGVARWAQDRASGKPMPMVTADVQDLEAALEASGDDPLDKTLLTLVVLRRKGVDARLVRGVRLIRGGRSADTGWLELRIGGQRRILDLGLPGRATLHDPTAATSRSWLAAPAAPVATWIPDPVTFSERPAPQPRDTDDDVWLRLHHLGAEGAVRVDPDWAGLSDGATEARPSSAPPRVVEPAPSAPPRPAAAPSVPPRPAAAPSAPPRPAPAPVTPEPPKPAAPSSGGWLDLDD